MRFVHADGSGDRMWHSNYGGVYCLSGDGNKVVMTGAVPTSSERVAMVLFVEDVGDASGTSRRQLTIDR